MQQTGCKKCHAFGVYVVTEQTLKLRVALDHDILCMVSCRSQCMVRRHISPLLVSCHHLLFLSFSSKRLLLAICGFWGTGSCFCGFGFGSSLGLLGCFFCCFGILRQGRLRVTTTLSENLPGSRQRTGLASPQQCLTTFLAFLRGSSGSAAGGAPLAAAAAVEFEAIFAFC